MSSAQWLHFLGMVRKQVCNVENQKLTSKTLVLAELLVKEMRKMAVKIGEWGPNARTRLIKKQRQKDTHARDKGWMRRGYFG
jgi:hypothetical protein